jgi:thiosulfate/3-mercaptopyruvate sulfurtransferase
MSTQASPVRHPEFIVEPSWLAEHLDDPQVRILDATTHLVPPPSNVLYEVKSGRPDFERGHIPGAAFVDLDAELSDHAYPPQVHFMLPTAQVFAEVMGRNGIDAATRVVCYSSANHWWATRLWWMFKVFGHDHASVLNGGFQRWQAEGRMVESGPGRPRAGRRFDAVYHSEYVADKDAVLSAVRGGEVCVVNALRPEQHRGTGGTSYGRLGHISGSVNVPAVHLVDAENRFKPVHELQLLLASTLERPKVITYCGGGIAATSVAMLLMMLGHRDVRLYDGSLSEWAANPDLPMAMGE